MKNFLLFTLLFLISSVGYIQAQDCPVTVFANNSDSCLYVSFADGQTPFASIVANGETYPLEVPSGPSGYSLYSIAEIPCDTVGMTAFDGTVWYITGTNDTLTCEFEGGEFQPPCPDTAYFDATEGCLSIVFEPTSSIYLPDSIQIGGVSYFQTAGDTLNYSLSGEECVTTGAPFDGDLTIGPSGCHYDAGLLPITILSFDFEEQDGGVELSWEINSDEPTRNLFLQKSYDGVDWTSVYEQNLAQYSTGQTMDGRYSDRAIDQPNVYYRLFISGMKGDVKYSSILPVTRKEQVINRVFFQSQSRSIMIKAGQNYTGQMNLYNTHGQNVMSTQVQMQKNTYQEIDVKGSLIPGVYFVKFDSGRIPPSKIFID